MRFERPHPGLVIRYSYLWRKEHVAGREEAIKDRPCAIVMTVLDADGRQEVLVLPMTHSPPADATDAIEIPPATKVRLGLDTDRSWVVIAEANVFARPGPDFSYVPGRNPRTIAYGVLPPRFFAHVRDKFLERDRLAKAARIKRTE